MEPNINNKDEPLDSRLTGQLLKLKDFVLQHASSEERLMEITAKITPLDRSIGPSESFLRQMRQRLVELGDNLSTQKAA